MISRCQWQHFEERWFFQNKYKQTLPSSYDVELKLIEFFRKYVASFSKQDSACPDQRFQRNRLKWIFFSVQVFWTLSANSIDSGKNLPALLSKLHATCPEVQFWELFWDKFEKFLICYILLSEKFPGRVVKTAFRDFTGSFWDENFFFNNKKNFCHFQTSSQKFMDCFQKKFLPVLSKQHSAFREKQFEAKWCFWKEYIVLLFMFSGRLKKNWVFGETVSACTSKIISSCPKQRF